MFWIPCLDLFGYGSDKWEDFNSPPPPAFANNLVQEIAKINTGPKTIMEISKSFYLDTSLWKGSGDRDAILASSGMGKSYLAGVILEELIECGGLLFIIDPEGEYYTLKDKYPMLIVGGEHANIDYDLDNPDYNKMISLIETVVRAGTSIIFDLSERLDSDKQTLFTIIGCSLFLVMDNKSIRRPLKFVVDEAQVFAPQMSKSLPSINFNLKESDDNNSKIDCLTVCKMFATRARKRGINLMWMTQRLAGISKDILGQCNRWWFGGVRSEQDYKAVKAYLENAGISEDLIRNLGKHEFYFWADGADAVKIKSRKRKCKHGGETPMSALSNKIASKSDYQNIIESLNRRL